MSKFKFTLSILGLFFTFHLSGLPLFGQTRLGLHVTQEELTIWRDRANRGPYKVTGDAQANSPGDWSRIATNAVNFNTNANLRLADRAPIYTGTGCYPSGTAYEPHTSGNLLRDAAFYYLIKQDGAYLANVRAEILRFVRDPNLNFANTARFCGFRDANPGFAITEWLTKVIFAYDYARIGGGFSVAEQSEINAWVYKAGKHFSNSIDLYYSARYVNRLGGDYTLTAYSKGAEANSPHATLYYGGPKTGWFTDGYNNRMLTIGRFVAIAGVLSEATDLEANAKRMFTEMMKYGVFPNGDIGDMMRWKAPSGYEGPETGLNYSFSIVGAFCDIADVFARKGDNSLYNYSTVEGYYGTAAPGNPKSLLQVIQNTQKYMNGTHVRYAYGSATTNPAYLINGVESHMMPSGEVTFDNWLAVANQYYRNASVSNNYLRKAAGCRPYPATPRSTGPNHPWGGQAAIYPATLFMFGQTEGRSWPYAPVSNPAPVVSITSPTSGTNFTAGVTITITANATDANGSVTQVEFFRNGTSLGVDNAAPYSLMWSNATAGNQVLTAVATDNAGVSTTSAATSIVVGTSLPTNCSATGTILRESWSNVTGTGVSAIPVTLTPSSSSQMTSFQGPAIPAGTWGIADNYAARYRGYVCVPTTGNYTFWIASDNDGELWLSTDANPANKKRIAYIQDGFAYINQWTKYASQQSAPIALQAGQKYYIEALHKEDNGGDVLAVGWQLPGGVLERPIPGARLSPFVPTAARVSSEATAEELSQIIAFPNPFDNMLTLQWAEQPKQAVSVSLIDSYGRVRHQQATQLTSGQRQLTVDVSPASLPGGIYYVRVQSDNRQQVIRLMKH
ncbi:MAG: Ig-like domain-containing protein [Bacteroidota bacterium]